MYPEPFTLKSCATAAALLLAVALYFILLSIPTAAALLLAVSTIGLVVALIRRPT